MKAPSWSIRWFPIVFLASWIGISWLISRCGWSALAERFRFQDTYSGQRKHFQWGMVGWVSYRNCLTIGADRRGLYLAVMPLFAFGSPPLLIPWNQLRRIEKKTFLFVRQAVLDIGTPTIATLRIDWRWVQQFRPWLDPALIGVEDIRDAKLELAEYIKKGIDYAAYRAKRLRK